VRATFRTWAMAKDKDRALPSVRGWVTGELGLWLMFRARARAQSKTRLG
jgi:hypothetical protein